MSKPIRLVPQTAQAIEFSCPLCDGVHPAYVFGTRQFRIYRCGGCGLTFGRARPNDGPPPPSALSSPDHELERDRGQHASLLQALRARSISGPVMLVADPDDELVALVTRHGIGISRVITHDDFGAGEWGETYGAAIVSRALMRVPDPRAALTKFRRHLATGADLFLSLPFLDGHQAELMGRNWHEWQASNRWYFTRESLNLLLLRPTSSMYGSSPSVAATPSMSWSSERDKARRLLRGWAAWRLFVGCLRGRFEGGISTSFRYRRRHRNRGPAAPESVVSIIVPVYNERATLEEMMRALLAKQLPGMRKEVIIVESNSTDGSRSWSEATRDIRTSSCCCSRRRAERAMPSAKA